MTPAEARQALIDSLTVERFTLYRPPVPATACAGCGASIPAGESCPTCARVRHLRAVRAS